jgi:hypothetical protein
MSVPIIDSSGVLWSVQRVAHDELQLRRDVVIHNQNFSHLSFGGIDTLQLQIDSVYVTSPYLYTIKVLIRITKFDLGYQIVKASYINDFYVGNFWRVLKYGSTVRELETSQVAENGVSTSAYRDKLQGLQIEDGVITITANDRDLQVNLFGGAQSLLQVRKECGFSFFGFSLFCGLIQTEIFISLE